MALGGILAITEAGFKIPEDISIINIGDYVEVNFFPIADTLVASQIQILQSQ